MVYDLSTATTLQSLLQAAKPDLIRYWQGIVQQALQRSQSKDCSSDEALRLLDEAWEVQKYIWRLRSQL